MLNIFLVEQGGGGGLKKCVDKQIRSHSGNCASYRTFMKALVFFKTKFFLLYNTKKKISHRAKGSTAHGSNLHKMDLIF